VHKPRNSQGLYQKGSFFFLLGLTKCFISSTVLPPFNRWEEWAMTSNSEYSRGRKESPASRFKKGKHRTNAALNAVLEHPFWGQFPKAFSNGIDWADEFFEKAEFDEALADRVACALRLVIEHGKFGESEQVFLNAARAEFHKEKSFFQTTIDFVSVVVGSADPDDKKTPAQVRDHLDLVYFVYVAARDKPELLDHLNDSEYRQLDPSAVDKPDIDKLLYELVEKKLLTRRSYIDAVKGVLPSPRTKWTIDRCDEARRLFDKVGYLENIELEALRHSIDRYREKFPKNAAKAAASAHALRLMYTEEIALRFEFVCYTMHIARISIHA
jgi:hypothetical protein